MLQAFIITLREGVEASLIVGIVFAYLSKIGRLELKRTVFWALGSAIVASIGVAVVVARHGLQLGHRRGVGDAGGGGVRDQHDLVHAQDGADDEGVDRGEDLAVYGRERGCRRLGFSFLCFCWCCARAWRRC